MTRTHHHATDRREFLVGALAAGALLAQPGMAQAQAADAATDAVRRLRVLATQNALTRLSQPGGFWNSTVARIGLPLLFVKRGGVPAGPLAQSDFRVELQHRLNTVAEAGARDAAPVIAQAARIATVTDPLGILRGRPTAAASQLRLEMGSELVNALWAPLDQALVAAQDPIVTQAVAVLPGVTLKDVAQAVALAADNGIWYEIGLAEAEIRANPAATGDAALIAALTAPVPGLAPSPAPRPGL